MATEAAFRTTANLVMPRLPSKSPLRPLPEFQQQRLARWLLEWQLDQELRNSRSIEEDETAIERDAVPLNPVVAVEPSPFDPNVKVGDIRLLSSTLAPAAELPIIIAVLQEWGAQFLVAPFSRFAEPATPDELLLRGEPNADPDVRVLALWNAHTVPVNNLRMSWRYGRLTEDELEDALVIFRDKLCDEPLPENLAARVGPPIVASWDPRHAYVAEGIALLAPLTEASAAEAAAAESPSMFLPAVGDWLRQQWHEWKEAARIIGQEAGEFGQDLAQWARRHVASLDFPTLAPTGFRADDEQRAGDVQVAEFRIEDSGALFHVVREIPSKAELMLQVLEDPSGSLEGAEIVNVDGGLLATVRNGLSSNPFEVADGWLLIRFAGGGLAALTRVRG